MSFSKNLKFYLLAIVITIIWGSSFVITRYVVQTVPPYTICFFRTFFCACFMWLLMAFSKTKADWRALLAHWKLVFLMVLCSAFGFNLILGVGLQYTTAMKSSLVNSITPLICTIFAFLIVKESLTVRKISGLLISLLGVAFVICGDSILSLRSVNFNAWDLLFLLSSTGWALYTVLNRVVPPEINPIFMTTIIFSTACLLFLPLSLREGVNYFSFDALSYWSMIYLGVLPGGVSFVLWRLVISRIGASRAAFFINFQPLWSLALAWLILQESLSPLQLLGGLISIAGVFWGLSTKKKKPDVPEPFSGQENQVCKATE